MLGGNIRAGPLVLLWRRLRKRPQTVDVRSSITAVVLYPFMSYIRIKLHTNKRSVILIGILPNEDSALTVV